MKQSKQEHINQHFDALRQMLQLEKEEDRKQYQAIIEGYPLAKRIELGYALQPLTIHSTAFTIGGYPYIVFLKPEHLQGHSSIKSGSPVSIYPHDGDDGSYINGVIHYQNDEKIRVDFHVNELPDWLEHGKFGLQLLFDERTYQEMYKAIDLAENAKNNRLASLRNVILRLEDPTRILDKPDHHTDAQSTLNSSQQAAVHGLINATEIGIIHGPPGTGKTTTLVAAIQELLQEEHNVLVTAASNTAVDVLAERLNEAGVDVVRVGHVSRMSEEIASVSLEARVAEHPDTKEVKKLRIEAADLRRKAQKAAQKGSPEGYQLKRQLYQEARETSTWARTLEDRIIQTILDQAQVIATTFVGSQQNILKKRTYPTVIIDEAAQALEPATWIVINKADKVWLAGDPFQLPPTVKSHEANQLGLSKTILEDQVNQNPDIHLLDVQYRMHNSIMDFSNMFFYEGKLQAHETVADHRLFAARPPIVYIDTAGTGFNEKQHRTTKSYYNPEEFQLLSEHLYQLVDDINVEDPPSITILSPYREQVYHIRRTLEQDERLKDVPIRVSTIDGYQGQEADIVYISLVRSNTASQIGFLKDYRRMNVAMTRAKYHLIVVGDSGTIGADDYYQQFLDYVEQHGGYDSAWSYLS